MKRFGIDALVLAGCMAAALSCGGSGEQKPAGDASSAGPAELVIWHGYRAEEKAAFERVVEQFNAAMASRGIRASTLAVPYDAFADKITAAVPRGKGPDIFIFAQDRLGGWIEAGNTIEPIDFFVEPAIRERFIPTTLEAMTYRGQIYGLPLNYKVITMIYNKDLVDAPPRTTSELVRVAREHTDAAAGRYGLAYWYSDFYYHSPLMNGFGGGVFDGRSPTVNRPENVRSVELLMQWLDQEGILPAEPTTALITSLFNQDKAAIVFSGPWFLGEIDDSVDYGLATLPTIDVAGNRPMRPWMTVEGVYITAPSRQKDAAYEFLKFVTDVPAATVLAVEGRQTPANHAVYEVPEVANDPTLQAFREQVAVAVPMPNLAEMAMFWSPVTTAMNTIVKKSATPQAALDIAQEEVRDRIERLR